MPSAKCHDLEPITDFDDKAFNATLFGLETLYRMFSLSSNFSKRHMVAYEVNQNAALQGKGENLRIIYKEEPKQLSVNLYKIKPLPHEN